MTDERKYDPAEKLRWEIEKLQAEAEHLRRPWLKTPASWVAIVTTMVALAGVALQSARSNREYELAEIRHEKTQLDIVRAEEVRKQTEASLRKVQAQRARAEKEFEVLQRQINGLKAQLPSTPEAQAAFSKTKESLEALKAAGTELDAQTDQAVGELEALGETLREPAPSSLPAFAVVASFTNLQHAEKFARDLLMRDRSYPVEIYQRERRRFAVTLGGYLTYAEANRRVDYARSKGLSADAYVRFAKNWGEPVASFPERL